MLYISRIFLVIIAIVTMSTGTPEGQTPDLGDLHTKIWIDSNAKNFSYNSDLGIRQVTYDIQTCFPASDFINSLVLWMNELGWKRLDEDFLNPQLKLNHTRGPGLWSHIISNENICTYQWIEDWIDTDGNIARYVMTYSENEQALTGTMCKLKVVTVYIEMASLKQEK